MPLKINIVTTINNGVGLQVDTQLLQQVLTSMGHYVRPVHRLDPNSARPADLNIFIEIVSDKFFFAAPCNWLIPNPEWYYPQAWDRYLPKIDTVLCKTPDAHRLFNDRHRNAIYTGFMSVDLFDPKVRRRREFLHVQGKSRYKNTLAVLKAWDQYKIKAPLTVLAENNPMSSEIENVTWLGYVTPGVLRALYNSRLFHLCPSEYEGFGHYIHEALGCESLVVTSDLQPMNQFKGCPAELLVPVRETYQCQIATMARIDPTDVAGVVERCMSLDDDAIETYRREARIAYDFEVRDFQERLAKVVGSL
jgi:glycosyl transferase family 1